MWAAGDDVESSDEEDDKEERERMLKKIAFPEVEKETPSSNCQKISGCIGKRLKKLNEGIKILNDITNPSEQQNSY